MKTTDELETFLNFNSEFKVVFFFFFNLKLTKKVKRS